MDKRHDYDIDSFTFPLVALDPSLRVVRHNRPFRDVFGLDSDSEPGTPLMELIPDKVLEIIVRLGSESEEFLPNAEFAWPGGTGQRDFLVSVSSAVPPAETVVVVFHEVTEWKQRQHKLIEDSRMASLGTMVAGIAHEINNPLAGIMGLSQLVLNNELDSSVRKDLESILGQAKKASEVVANLRIFAGVHKPRKQLINLVPVLQRVLDMKSDWFRASGVTISTRIGQHSYMVEGDAHQLEQVFVNIVTNAQQAILEGGVGKTLSVELGQVGHVVRLTFSDDGPGIDGQDLPKIFEPFFTTREVGKGTGLGLSMCLRIVHEHDGTIRAESKPGKGATFTVDLPAARDLAPSMIGEQDLSTYAITGGMKVLIVDDEPCDSRVSGTGAERARTLD